MKAISPIIAIIIILLVTIAIAGAGYSYINVYWTGLMGKQIQVLDSSCYQGSQGKILIRNTGTSDINTSEIGIVDAQTGEDISQDVLWDRNISDPSLVLELRFDDGSGTAARDTSGQGNDGTLTNLTGASCFTNGACPEWVNGRAGGALEFDEDGDAVDCGNDTVLQLNTLSVSAWININSHAIENAIVAKGTEAGSSGNGWYFFIYETGKPAIQSNDGTVGGYDFFRGDTVLDTGRWYHVAAVLYTDGSTRNKIYVNGIEEAMDSQSGIAISSIQDSGESLWVGYFGYNGTEPFFNGIIDEIRIYNRTLGPAEIRALAENSVILEAGETAALTHTCSGVCSYSMVLPGGTKETMLEC